MNDQNGISTEQRHYAACLHVCSRIGLVVLCSGFGIYISGCLKSIVNIQYLPGLLRLRVDEFVAHTGMPVGWDWTRYILHGEIVANLGILFLASTSFFCLISTLPILIAKRNSSYIVIVILQLLVLLLGASGWPIVVKH